MKNHTLSEFFSSSTEFSAIDHFLQLMVKTNTFDKRLYVLQEQLCRTEQDNHLLQEKIISLVQKEKRYEQDVKSLTLKFSTKIADLERKESTYQQDVKSLKQQFNAKIADLESRENKYRLEIEQLKQKNKQPVVNTKAENVQASLRPKTQTIHSNNELEQGVWTDPKTGLMWARISIGQEWKNGQCSGEAKTLIWEEAQKACKDFRLASYNDWRLPSRNELETLMTKDSAGYDCTQGFLFQPEGGRMGVYWSASAVAGTSNYVLGVGFGYGSSNGYRKDYGGYVRAVRSGQ